MRNYMMVKQRITDFAQFQAAFDQLLPMRQKYGLIDIGTFRAAEEPNTIIVLMEVTDLARQGILAFADPGGRPEKSRCDRSSRGRN